MRVGVISVVTIMARGNSQIGYVQFIGVMKKINRYYCTMVPFDPEGIAL